jgi:uncharacterized protein
MENNPVKPSNALRLAVLTGGHGYDEPNFQGLFGRLAGLDVAIQPLDDFAALPPQARDAYAAVLFYCMPTQKPDAESRRWYTAGVRAALEHLRETGQGLVVLHHAILAYPEWPLWREVSGIDPALQSYQHDQRMRLHVAAPDHPITTGMADFELVDETYRMGEPDPGCEVLLTTDHPLSLRSIAWARHFGRSRVFCLALGHDNACWSSPAFEQLLARGIRWTVGG